MACYELIFCCYLPTAYCPFGKEVVNGKCEMCKRGFYQGSMEDSFDKCKACPVDYITTATGATHLDNCTIGKLLSLTGIQILY